MFQIVAPIDVTVDKKNTTVTAKVATRDNTEVSFGYQYKVYDDDEFAVLSTGNKPYMCIKGKLEEISVAFLAGEIQDVYPNDKGARVSVKAQNGPYVSVFVSERDLDFGGIEKGATISVVGYVSTSTYNEKQQYAISARQISILAPPNYEEQPDFDTELDMDYTDIPL